MLCMVSFGHSDVWDIQEMITTYFFLPFMIAHTSFGAPKFKEPKEIKQFFQRIKRNVNGTSLVFTLRRIPNNDFQCDADNPRLPDNDSIDDKQPLVCQLCSNGCNHRNFNNMTCNSVVFGNATNGPSFEARLRYNTHFKDQVIKQIVHVCGKFVNCVELVNISSADCQSRKRPSPPKTWWSMIEDILLVISLLCLLFTLFVHMAIPELRNLHGKNISSFTFALLVSQLFLFHDFGINDRFFCIGISVMLQYFWMVVFIWTSILSFDIARTFRVKNILKLRPDGYNGNRFSIYSTIAWGTPVILVSASYFATDNIFGNKSVYSHEHNCFMILNVAIFAIGIPIAICLSFNFICFAIIIHGMESHRCRSALAAANSTRRNGDRVRCFIYAKVSIMCGVSWIVFFLVQFGEGFRHVSSLILNFQGVLIFLCTVLSNKRAMIAVRRRISLNTGNKKVEVSTISQ